MHPITAYLAVANVTASMEFLERVMSFTRGVTLPDTDGQLRYAEMRHGDSVVMLVRRGDAISPSGGAPALYAYVADVDRAMTRARENGAGTGDIEDKPWGDRVGTVTDPDGYRWLLATFRKLVAFE
jgi:PhnB protein